VILVPFDAMGWQVISIMESQLEFPSPIFKKSLGNLPAYLCSKASFLSILNHRLNLP
jgi:hypothetical protein